MKHINVLVIAGQVTKSPEGITSSFVFDEAYRLAKRGLEVHVIRAFQEMASFSHGIHFHGLENVPRVKYLAFMCKHLNAIPNLGYLVPPWRLFSISKYAHAATKIANSQNVDLIHAHFAYPEGLTGLLTKKEIGKPLVVTLHGYDILVEPSVKYGARLSKRINYLIRGVLNNAEAVTAASSATFNEANRIVNNVKKIHLIQNGVDIQRFNPSLDASHIRKNLGIEGSIVVFTLRAHEPQYGLEYLIRAVPIVLKERKDVVFVIGGNGSLRRFHDQLASKLGVEENVIFNGKIPRSETPYYYAMSDMVVVPSLQEAFGLVVSEAMACGKPVIGTKVGGIPDQIIYGYNGFLVQPRSPPEIAEKILSLISNPKEAKRMGMNGRKIVEQKFNIDERIDKIIQLYEMFIK